MRRRIALLLLGIACLLLAGLWVRSHRYITAATAAGKAEAWAERVGYEEHQVTHVGRFANLADAPPGRTVYVVSTRVLISALPPLTACFGILVDAETGEVYGAYANDQIKCD